MLLIDGTVEGRRAPLKEYTDRWVCMHEELQLHRETERLRVKNLPGDGAPWVSGRRSKDDGIFEEDHVTELTGIGDETANKLKSFGSIKKVTDLAMLHDEDLQLLAEMNSLSYPLLDRARTQVKTAKSGKYRGKIINHKNHPDPYRSRYPDNYIEMVDASTAMRKWISIRELVLHMAVETDEMMKGTQFEGKGLFKHDALSLMTAKATRVWMQRYILNGRSLYSRWLLPEQGLNATIEMEGGRTNTRFRDRPPGNLPRLMSLDEAGNKALRDAVNRHIYATRHLVRANDVETDPKYEFCDVVRASRAIRRCWDPAHGPTGGAPSNDTIVESHRRVWGKHLGEIRANKGRMVGARSGHRRAEKPSDNWGGLREKGSAPWVGEGEWLHADARMAQAQKFAQLEVNVGATN